MELRIKILRILVFLLFLIWITFLFASCEKEKAVFFPPELGELKITEITDSSATASCKVVKTDGIDIIECGFCVFPKNDTSLVRYIKCGNAETFFATITELSSQTSYIVKAYAKNVVGLSFSETFFDTDIAATGTMNGFSWVNLDLPSGTLWATRNIGASSPEGLGNYYAWGEITPKNNYSQNNYTYSLNPTTLPASGDAATANWGAGWKMPTYDEMKELLNNCTWNWTIQNSVSGYTVTSHNGNSIFLPAAGFCSGYVNSQVNQKGDYLTSTISESGCGAKGLSFSDASNTIIGLDRYMGFSVRAVCNFNSQK